MTRAQALGVAFATVMAIAPAARAQTSGQDVATAQALFDEGKRLMAANNYAEACPKLLESQRLDPGGGTLFAIALCHEGEGKTATAWADYSVAQSEARRDGRKDREQAAAEKAKALEPRLTKMRIVVAKKAPGLELTRDGGAVGEAQWGLALPIDPGPHAFTAKAPGKVEWTSTVDIRGEGKTVDVNVPALVDAPRPYDTPETKPVTPPPPVKEKPVEPESSSQKTWAFVAGAAGIVSVGVGLGFGVAASSKWSDAETKCPQKRCINPKDTELGDQAGRAADVSTVLVGIGAGAVLAGVILWLTAPKDPERALRIAPTVAKGSLGLSLGGSL
jgi:hypothetical protein